MATLKEWRDEQEKRRAAEPPYDAEAAHRQRVAKAKSQGLRNLSAEEYVLAADLAGPEPKPREARGWPEDAPAMFNANNEPCDMWDGPCACGASHREGI